MEIEVLLLQLTTDLMNLQIRTDLVDRIMAAQSSDHWLMKIHEQVADDLYSDFLIHEDRSPRYGGRICVTIGDIRDELLREAQSSPYSLHPGDCDEKMTYYMPNHAFVTSLVELSCQLY